MTHRKYMHFVVVAILMSFGIWHGAHQPQARAQETNITVRDAYAAVQRGEMVLIDIRAPKEWQQSGIASVAEPITMYQPTSAFLSKINAVMEKRSSKTIALICAKGGRTLFLQRKLKKLGYTNILNVTGGMFGTNRHVGWLGAKLPIRKWTPKP